MKLPGRGKNKPSVDVRQIVLGALASALNDGGQQRPDNDGKKKGLTGVRALAAGAALVTAGRAAYKGREFIRERLGRDEEDEPVDEAEYEDDEYYEDEDYEEDEEPEAEAEADFEDEPEGEDDEEPEAEAEEDFEDEPERGGGRGGLRGGA